MHRGAPVTFSYLRDGSGGRSPIWPSATLMVYSAASSSRFTRNYGEEAHRVLAAEGLAPELLYCGAPYLEYPNVDGVKMVVSTFDGAGMHVKTCQAAANAREKPQHAVDVLHRRGFVHGDLRWRNVLVAEDGRVSLLRFDWAGRIGEARYPEKLGRLVIWPSGAAPGTLIMPEHDQEWLDRVWVIDGVGVAHSDVGDSVAVSKLPPPSK
ncbi:hypothetical protein OH76DRAFT_381468 [Lentinus brumalis]|uniref:Uncharacterized protein n=1 Tax=Lentinus brumalis TaxID=2498619 RepID=A0A371DV05_9APHY|nr:hypothetical protein OH76DRAFT_381468 [Polyporus brumalis]